MLSLDSRVSATKEQVSCELGGEATILSLKNGKYYNLSDVGARIWDLLAEEKPVREIYEALLQLYDVEAERCENDLLRLLQDMAEQGLVEVRNEQAA